MSPGWTPEIAAAVRVVTPGLRLHSACLAVCGPGRRTFRSRVVGTPDQRTVDPPTPTGGASPIMPTPARSLRAKWASVRVLTRGMAPLREHVAVDELDCLPNPSQHSSVDLERRPTLFRIEDLVDFMQHLHGLSAPSWVRAFGNHGSTVPSATRGELLTRMDRSDRREPPCGRYSGGTVHKALLSRSGD